MQDKGFRVVNLGRTCGCEGGGGAGCGGCGGGGGDGGGGGL